MSHGPPSLLDEKTSWAEFGRGLGVWSLAMAMKRRTRGTKASSTWIDASRRRVGSRRPTSEW